MCEICPHDNKFLHLLTVLVQITYYHTPMFPQSKTMPEVSKIYEISENCCKRDTDTKSTS